MPQDKKEKQDREKDRVRGAGLDRWTRIRSEVITVRLPRGVTNRVRDVAERDDASIAHVFRIAMERYLQDIENPIDRARVERERVQRELLADPGFVKSLAQQLAEVQAGKAKRKARKG